MIDSKKSFGQTMVKKMKHVTHMHRTLFESVMALDVINP